MAEGVHTRDEARGRVSGPGTAPDARAETLPAARETGRGLIYPFAAAPPPGGAVEVAPGVLWLRFGLPLALDHVNVYAIDDGDGWAVVDTGMDTPPTREAWETALAGPLAGRRITRVICTHMHPDHLGLAGWLCRRFSAPLVMTRLEYVTARMLVADFGQAAPQEALDFHRRTGWTEAQVERLRRGWGQFGRAVSRLPAGFERIAEGDVLSIGGREWRVVVGEGHSPEHACLWREDDGVFLSGDQILPKISSIVSVFATEPLADPLGDWLRSLERLKARLPDELLVLPAHGEPFQGVQTRLSALLRGHETALTRLERTLREPKRAVDVFAALFAREIGDDLLGMATGESLAHLNHLERRGCAVRRLDAEGVEWWTAAKGDDDQ